ncbi:MAG: hypothetical protein HXY20_01855 [Acidobacteria bacterium]|nr:hypothetical protein [Acidobacteriota bacterium]
MDGDLGLLNTPCPWKTPRLEQGLRLELQCPAEFAKGIASVDFQGWYYRYDENGNLRRFDWHGFTKDRLPMATLGTVTEVPFTVDWDTSLVLALKQNWRGFTRVRGAAWLYILTGLKPDRPESAEQLLLAAGRAREHALGTRPAAEAR